MPLTFAHPAAVLPFVRNKTYVHFPALVLGSMAPDFEYFLRGRPSGVIGHTMNGFFTLNLFLVILTYLVYRYIIYPSLFKNLPAFVQSTLTLPSELHKTKKLTLLSVLVFVYSALLGMASHVIWDSFTHQEGYMVLRWELLQETLSITTYELPVYKMLQHGSTLLGLSIIFLFVLNRLWKHQNEESSSVFQLNFRSRKWRYWLSLGVLMIFICILWMVNDPISLSEYGVYVVRVIDSALLSLLFVSLAYHFCQPILSRIRH